MCIQPVKVHGQKFEYVYIYILIYLVEIIHRVGGKWSSFVVFFFLRKIKWHSLSLFFFFAFVFLTRTKQNDLNSIYTKQNKTQWSIQMTTRKKKRNDERDYTRKEESKILDDYQFINEKSTSAWRLNGNVWFIAWH